METAELWLPIRDYEPLTDKTVHEYVKEDLYVIGYRPDRLKPTRADMFGAVRRYTIPVVRVVR